jgi:RNA polymerase sigma-70 factor (ECF subfamily)
MFERFQTDPSRDKASDTALWRAAVRGSQPALVTLYRCHAPLIYRYSLRMCGDASAAEEVTQEVFLALLNQAGQAKQDRFDPARAALSTWLYGIARRQVWKYLDRRERSLPAGMLDLDDEDQELEAHAPEDDPATMLSRREAVDAVRAGIEELALPLREVILLCEFEEMTYQEAATIVGVPVGTIRSRLHRAKARLAKALRAETVGKSISEGNGRSLL